MLKIYILVLLFLPWHRVLLGIFSIYLSVFELHCSLLMEFFFIIISSDLVIPTNPSMPEIVFVVLPNK